MVFTTAWEAIKLVWDTAVGFFQGVWNGIVNAFSTTITFFTNTFTSAWNGIVAIWNAVVGFFQGIWNGITNAFSATVGWFANIFGSAWEGIKSIWSGVGSFFQGIWQTIVNIFSTIGVTVANAVQDAIKGGVNGILWLVENVLNTPIRLINGAIDIINYIPGVDIPHIQELQLPRLAKGTVLENGARTVIAGEDGAEAIVPLEKHTEWIKRVAGELNAYSDGPATNKDYDNKIDKIIELLTLILDSDTQIVLDDGTTIGWIDKRLGLAQTRRGRG